MSPDVNGLFESFGKVKQKDDENATRVVSNIIYFHPYLGK